MNPLSFLSLASYLALGSSFRTSTTHLHQRIPNACATKTGDSCVFPFTYQGTTYSQCTYSQSPVPWCATQTDSQGVVVTNKWGDCDVSATSGCQSETITSPTCTTESGPKPNQPCVFPFRHLGITYNQCTNVGQSAAWCSTTVDAAGTHMVGEYGFCPSSCPSDSSGSGSSLSCTPGTISTVDCNTCVCNSQGENVCSTLVCTGATTTTTTTTTTASTTTTATTTTTTTPTACTTVSGPASSTSCVFPFTYAGTTHTTCAPWVYGGENQGKFWCSTKVDDFGVHVNGEGNYGFCDTACTSPKDNTFFSTDSRRASRPGAVVFGASRPASRGRQPL